MPERDTESGPLHWRRILVLVLVYAAILAAGQWGGTWLGGHVLPAPGTPLKAGMQALIVLSFVAYIVLLAIPFVPGVEISIAIMAALGPKAALPIYLATIAALAIAYLIGHLVPLRALAAAFGYLGLDNAKALVLRLEPMTPNQRIETLTSAAPTRLVPVLLKRRYLATAVALNTPGNAIIGGGGGIAMLAGMSRFFSFPFYLAMLCLAALPIPLAIWLMGKWW